MKMIFFDTATADLPENAPENVSILAKISYIFLDTDTKKVFFESSFIKPDIKVNPRASIVNSITNIDVGLEPDINGKYRDVPRAYESEVLKHFLGGVKKYKKERDFYLVGFNIEEFDLKVLDRAVNHNILYDVNRIDLYRISKYLFYTEEGRKLYQKKEIPESISLKYLKYFLKLYYDEEKLKTDKRFVNILSEKNNNLVGVYNLFNYYKDNFFRGDIQKMFQISSNLLVLDYVNFGYLRGEKISEIESNKLLNLLGKVDDNDLSRGIIKTLIERGEDKNLLIKIKPSMKKEILKETTINEGVKR